jgi:hypothetical protein
MYQCIKESLKTRKNVCEKRIKKNWYNVKNVIISIYVVGLLEKELFVMKKRGNNGGKANVKNIAMISGPTFTLLLFLLLFFLYSLCLCYN